MMMMMQSIFHRMNIVSTTIMQNNILYVELILEIIYDK